MSVSLTRRQVRDRPQHRERNAFAAAPRMAPYNVTKAGVISLSRQWPVSLTDPVYRCPAQCRDSSEQSAENDARSSSGARHGGTPDEEFRPRRSTSGRSDFSGVIEQKLYIVWPHKLRDAMEIEAATPTVVLGTHTTARRVDELCEVDRHPMIVSSTLLKPAARPSNRQKFSCSAK